VVGEHLNVRLALCPIATASPELREEAACKGIVAVVILFTAPLPPVAMATSHSGPASSLHGNAQWWGC
jgi:hypothetical protein